MRILPARGWGLPMAAGLVIACIGWWTWLHATGRAGYGQYLADPAAWDGREVVLSLVRVEEHLGSERTTVRKGTLMLDVMGEQGALPLGAEVTVGGRWRAEELAIEAAWVAPAPGRGAKKWLGLIGLGFVTAGAGLAMRRSPDGMVLRG